MNLECIDLKIKDMRSDALPMWNLEHSPSSTRLVCGRERSELDLIFEAVLWSLEVSQAKGTLRRVRVLKRRRQWKRVSRGMR